MREYKYKPTTALKKINALLKPSGVFIVQGGQGAGKTISILQLLIDFAYRNPKKEITIASHQLSKMKGTVVRDFIKIMKDYNLFVDSQWNKSSFMYVFPDDTYIEFIPLDRDDVGKGMRRDVVYFNEGNKVTYDAFVQVYSRSKLNIIDFNPDKRFFAHDLIKEDNFITLTFNDNEYLPESERNSILDYKVKGFYNTELVNYDTEENVKNKWWANKWRVYGEGKIGMLDGLVFQNWNTIDKVPDDAELIGYGLDFGYTNDPTALTACYKWNGKTILDQKIYASNLSNQDIANLYDTLGLDKQALTIADSSEPKTIAELKKYRINVQGAIKGADSVKFGLSKMQEHEFLITTKSQSLMFEFQNYSWKKDRDGNVFNIPEDKYNHGIDGIRYLLTNNRPRFISGASMGS